MSRIIDARNPWLNGEMEQFLRDNLTPERKSANAEPDYVPGDEDIFATDEEDVCTYGPKPDPNENGVTCHA